MRVDQLFAVIPVAIGQFDNDGTLVFANARARTLLGLDASPRPDRETLETVLAPLMGVIEPLIQTARAGLMAPPAIARFTGVQGERIVEVSVGIMSNGNVLVSASDITARESLLESLERRSRELASIFEVTPSSVRVITSDERIVRANSSAVREHPGARPQTLDELIALDQPLYPTTRQPLRKDLHPVVRALRGEMVQSERYILLRGVQREQRIVEMHGAPVKDGANRTIEAVMVCRDVTDQHRLAENLATQVRRTTELNERVSTEAERLDRMVEARSKELLAIQETRARDRRLTAVGQLAAGVMHDVNNALNPIMAAAWLLDRHAEDPMLVRDYAQRIARAAETGAATASRVGRFLRQEPIDSGLRDVVDLSVIAEEVLQLSEPLIAERKVGDVDIRIHRSFVEGATVRGMSGELREAVLNLVQNAVDAMPHGGSVTVRTVRVGETVCLEVVDTGIGMSDEVRERAFEPFFSTKGSGGSGLGLAEVYGIVRRHRGSVELRSSEGEGTVVECCFPYAGGSHVSVQDAAVTSSVSRRILLVEDNADGREFVRRVLVEGGHAVEAVDGIAAARAKLRQRPTPFDLLITDIGLPDGSGWELSAEAHAVHPELAIGVVTGWEPTVPTEATTPISFILRKPLRAATLLNCVASLSAPAATSLPS